MTRPANLLFVVLGALAGCTATEPAGQLLLHVDTDAVLPTDGVAQPLFDAVRFDVYPPGSTEPCDHCGRILGLTESTVQQGDASFGLVANTEGARVRVRLYLTDAETGPEPRWDGTIEAWVVLPAIPEEGAVDLTVWLPTDGVGTSIGSLDAPLPAAEGLPAAEAAGSWWGAARRGCVEPLADHEACVPGGAFWMGHRKFRTPVVGGDENDRRRLVVVSPFITDLTEVTVADLRASGLVQPQDPLPWSGGDPGTWPTDPSATCVYTDTPGDWEALPINCISRDLAQAYCVSRGATLPTEAQLTWLMGGTRGQERPWGNGDPDCDDAVFGRATGSNQNACILPTERSGPLPAGAGLRDRLTLGDRMVLDLAGNMAEWALDWYNRQDGPCWGGGLFVDPLCTEPSPEDGPLPVARGGAWNLGAPLVHAETRQALHSGRAHPAYGFRCVRPATPGPLLP